MELPPVSVKLLREKQACEGGVNAFLQLFGDPDKNDSDIVVEMTRENLEKTLSVENMEYTWFAACYFSTFYGPLGCLRWHEKINVFYEECRKKIEALREEMRVKAGHCGNFFPYWPTEVKEEYYNRRSVLLKEYDRQAVALIWEIATTCPLLPKESPE